MHITLCARSKILALLEPGSSFRIQVTAVPQAGQHVDLVSNSEAREMDCTISTTPHVIADIQTMTHMADQIIDYNYSTDEFVICNRDTE